MLEHFLHIFNKETKCLVQYFKGNCDKPYIDVRDPITRFTLFSIGETAFGQNFQKDTKREDYLNAIHYYGEAFVYRIARPWFLIPWLYKLSPSGKRYQKVLKVLNDFSSSVISQRIAPTISRVVGEDITTSSGYTIPKGCNIRINIYDLHHRPEYWENPEKFDADRFLFENVSKRHPYSYIPFSAGDRNCIGQKYGKLEMKAALYGILRSFRMEAITKPADMRHKGDIVLRPACEMRIKFIPRD
ncbi:unnamed protein product [Diabrotica balteata]|uniref:Cytochrome P450 n=1 Tax=Diabrotica balteata TaxID=107213 RepID=A0A9N9SWV4_DIABA|nr:unnamed protein product [Diabrotica balteata]